MNPGIYLIRKLINCNDRIRSEVIIRNKRYQFDKRSQIHPHIVVCMTMSYHQKSILLPHDMNIKF